MHLGFDKHSGVEMYVPLFDVTPHNEHYEGAYSSTEIEWRRLGARDKSENIIGVLGNATVDSVLEVGCGTAAVLSDLAAHNIGKQHVGVDVTDPFEHLDDTAKHLDLRIYDGRHLPFADNSFDLVFASHVVEHVPDPRGFIKELRRVSRHLVYVEVPCEMTVRTSRASIQEALKIGHVNAYTPEYFMVLLQSADCTVIEMRIFDHSRAVTNFGKSRLKGWLLHAIRRGTLAAMPNLATKLFCYHVGALIDVREDIINGD
jgi:SAM-dependent methyltransferase